MYARMRRPNWTDEESLLLAQLIEERKEIIRRKCSAGVTSLAKRQAWEEIAHTINIGFPQYQRTVADCTKKWENLLAKSRNEIKRQRMHIGEDLSPAQLSDVTQIVLSVMNLSDRMDEEMKDPSILLLSETQQSFDEESNLCNTPLTENGHHSCNESGTIRLSDPFDSPEEQKVSFYNSVHHSPVMNIGNHDVNQSLDMSRHRMVYGVSFADDQLDVNSSFRLCMQPNVIGDAQEPLITKQIYSSQNDALFLTCEG
ncbi:unnamed protein product [Gadus morhua 'NCC']